MDGNPHMTRAIHRPILFWAHLEHLAVFCRPLQDDYRLKGPAYTVEHHLHVGAAAKVLDRL